MKKNSIISAFILLGIISCQKMEKASPATEKVPAVDTTKLVVDSVSVSDSLKINAKITGSFSAKVLVFPKLSDKSLLDSIYAVDKIQLEEYSKKNLEDAIKNKQKEYFASLKDDTKDLPVEFEQTWTQHSNEKVFSQQNGFLTVKYTGDGFSGGAHGYYYEYYKVFDLQNKKTLQLSDILISPDSSVWKRALWDQFIKNDTGKGQSDMLLVSEISPNSNFYFDQQNLYFLYNQYEIAAYAAGTVLIKIPISDVKPMLKPEWKKRMKIN